MTTRVWFISLLLGTWICPAHAADWQVVLLKPRGCNDCAFIEQILKRSLQLQRVVLKDGAGGQVTAPITRRDTADLSAQEWIELRSLVGFDEPAWRQRAAARSAQVLLKRDGVVVSAGDIADSADLQNARFPAALVTPDTGRDLSAVRNAQGAYLSELLLRSWNLDWFYRLALDPALARSRLATNWLDASAGTLTPPLRSANVLLMSTASGATDNEIFNALRIEEIRDTLLQSLALEPAQLHIFYGGGNTRGANALEVRDRRVSLIRRDVADASPFTPDAVSRIFQSIRAQPASRNLMVLVGHGNPDGAGMWSSPTQLSPATLRALHEHGGGDDVLVSGNCFGGVMARAMSCGFFGARPDIIATGCQADAAEVAQSRDYLHMFFLSLRPATRDAADADGDGVVSFAEAHWYASIESDARNVTYTSIDAMADAWFDTHPEALPRSLTVREILALTTDAPPSEARALRSLLIGHDANLALSLDNLAGQAAQWNPGGGAPRIMVVQLTRRLLFLKNPAGHGAELARLQSCENRSVATFLKP
ncbi:MAG: hypothetical protein ABIQ86_12540 [Steroidobacteraceae bacterium]